MTGLAAHTRHDRRAGQPRAAGTRSPAVAARAAPGPAGGDARRAASPLTWPLAVPERDRSRSGTAGPPGHAQPRPVSAVPGWPGLRASRRRSERHRGTASGTRPYPRFVITSAGSPASCARITSGNRSRRATRVLARPRKEAFAMGCHPGRPHGRSCCAEQLICRAGLPMPGQAGLRPDSYCRARVRRCCGQRRRSRRQGTRCQNVDATGIR
jgi:hypothetical protein